MVKTRRAAGGEWEELTVNQIGAANRFAMFGSGANRAVLADHSGVLSEIRLRE
jgi:hypothetical protein